MCRTIMRGCIFWSMGGSGRAAYPLTMLDYRRCENCGPGEFTVKESTLPTVADAKSPAGADIRFLMDGPSGNMIHSTVPPGQTNRATIHETVSEFWYILEGQGEIWRREDGGESVTALDAGVSIDIPVGTAFQYRNVGTEPLKFICIAMPPWPGDHEASHVEGAWIPTIGDE